MKKRKGFYYPRIVGRKTKGLCFAVARNPLRVFLSLNFLIFGCCFGSGGVGGWVVLYLTPTMYESLGVTGKLVIM